MRESAADNNRRVRFLHRLRPTFHLWKIDQFAVILGLVFGPDGFHCFDPLAHQLETGLKRSAVIGHLLSVPAAPDAEQKPCRSEI